MNDVNSEEDSFEKAFFRLEEILDQMNKESLSLDQSLKLYEEADQLITTCSQRLSDAEKKIQILIKNRNGELETDQDGSLKIKDFEKP